MPYFLLNSCKYELKFQDDCNLVTYPEGRNFSTWSASAKNWQPNKSGANQRPCVLKMQDDRNLVIYNKNNEPVWSIL